MNYAAPAPGPRILIVEDEFIISDTIAELLRDNGYRVAGEAISYEEAVKLYEEETPDLALLDIRLSGARTGIDVARYLAARPDPIPFVFLTSQVDDAHIGLARDTFPAGYLSKPIQTTSLLATIAVALHNHQGQRREETVSLRAGQATHLLPVATIRHLQADHVYVRVTLTDQKPLVLRRSLGELVKEIDNPNIVQTHRSHAVNLQHVTRYDNRSVYVDGASIPVSDTYRESVMARL
ncbi:LytR/AlgR family response regulator transcription factor [Lewinella sp. IMCC34183]|uniref:LytR/AlgR family response regulator transcription factor n=1 Tax=Lewinella sp. IMCC34183 TaxID=2248762 RepID=UPI000E282CE2|nr:response regulator [Lewinella sp. IMCC34183]